MTSSDFSLHGAIDLGARRAAAQRQQQRPASGASGDSSSSSVIDVTDATFNTEVVERSRSVPVLVDFWADWCQPCKQLGPILEKLANEAGGRWVLAKVDIDANPALGQQLARMGVQGIPFVAAVVAGQMLPVLNGAAPEPQVRQVLDQLFAALRQQGLLPEDDGADAAQQPAADPLELEAEAALQRGDLDGAATAFGRILETRPNDPFAKSGLALVDLQRRAGSYDPAAVRKDAADRPDDAAAQAKAADLELVEGRVDEAFDRLIDAVRRTTGDERDAARKHLLSLFDVLPPDDPRVARARRRLASALF
ncbi:tetratricopeptide repeat protein [Actinoallomurus rhizosphaericola]|uniref:tetratricopeptide repeat protein n=1 Tax=Actinoallomurus rhizosphaericola TaxID=2952536 RepID=UPI00209135EB|nr:tetratricopeptide repeat protein [Actinoallomurus rhizosphaericola]MCO5994000.1 tetratricopeptide repeat protein [Actinoallomurus rhizosphaericola]